MRQLLEAVEFIHSKFIVHRDLKVTYLFLFIYFVNETLINPVCIDILVTLFIKVTMTVLMTSISPGSL